jgi:hypothetical protein
MGTGSAVSGIQILCNYSSGDRYGLFGSGMKRGKKILYIGCRTNPYNPVDTIFGKNKKVKKILRTPFVVMAGLILARVVDPVTA